MLPWENPRWIRAFVAILIANVAIVFAFSRFTQIKPLIALAWVVILSNLGILVWFVFQIDFRNRKTLRNTLLVFVGGDALIACSAILYVRSKTLYAVIPILIILVLRRFWGPPLIEKLQAEIEQEESQSNPA